ncbi:MAG: hypothetical protein AUH25_00195 [Thaumarchaeota archaeon 13_1_40CM_38_12]|nr:MAG: hypothetical protein AUH25_00195 [Thaumarchaeota archaeon 13_1_40CM_38_12]OLC35161.1 MAG: hypothetical protein AUH84_03715 [Thaumarchaeota archaeon 13_1_40CM_4_38_7]
MIIESNSNLIESIVSIAVSVGGGTVLGYLLSERSRTRQEKSDIKKIKELLFDDFKRLNDIAMDDIKNDLVAFTKLENDDFIHELTNNRLSMTNFMVDHKGSYEFAFWNTINDSSLMIRLEPEDIRVVNAIHFGVSGLNSKMEKSFWEQYEEILSFFSNAPEEVRNKGMKEKLIVFFASTLVWHKQIYDALQVVSISWMKLKDLPGDTIVQLNDRIEKDEERMSKRETK